MDFYRRVETVCLHIPYGKVATYGQIALLCQRPQNSRQVGYALSHKITVEIPAHRIVNHQGVLSGAGAFSDNLPQRKLLRAEGVKINSDLKIDLKIYGWKNTLDDALLLEAIFKKKGI